MSESRIELVNRAAGMRVTLNGKPARVSGYRLDFARVTDAAGLSAEWSWSAVERILAKGGAFHA